MRAQLLTITVLGSFCIGLVFAEDPATDAKTPETKEQIPAGAKGFAGMITGKVIGKVITWKKVEVSIEVLKIDQVWKNNKAEHPPSLIGKQVTIKIVPQTDENVPEFNARVEKLSGLKVEDKKSFGVKHAEDNSLVFFELTKDQAEQVK